MAYTYWCLEKGYAQGDDEDIQETKNWIRTMQTDVWVTVLFITIGTLPFFFLGAGVLHYVPELREALSNNSFWDINIIDSLQNMFALVLGNWAMWLFIVLAFFVLFSTFLSLRFFSKFSILSDLFKDRAISSSPSKRHFFFR